MIELARLLEEYVETQVRECGGLLRVEDVVGPAHEALFRAAAGGLVRRRVLGTRCYFDRAGNLLIGYYLRGGEIDGQS